MRFTDYFAFQVRNRPDALCLLDDARQLTYVQADEASNQLANALSDLAPQTRVAVVADNSIEFLLLDLATTKANLVLVPVNTRLIPDEWATIVEHAGATVVFAGAPYRPGLTEVRHRLASVQQWVSIDGVSDDGWVGLADFVEPAHTASPVVSAADDDIGLQLYTSGTTGLPKGVLHTHRSLTISLTQWGQMVEPWDGFRGRSLIAAPLFHGATILMWRTTVCWGGHVHVQPRFTPDGVLDAAAASPIAWTFLVPSMIHACLERARERPAADYQFNLIMYGGSPIAEVTLREAMAVLGKHFVQIYGLTESLLTTILTPTDHTFALAGRPELLLSAGRPIAGVTLSLEDPNGKPVATGEAGEVVITCPNPMVGYWNNPIATNDMLRDGRLHSGDAGRLDGQGYLYVQDRIKDMIVTGGENVFSTEVEAVLHAHPDVDDVAVIGTPDPRWGEVVTALIVPRNGTTPDLADIVGFCRPRISGYKIPKRVEVVEALPRNSTGKLLKTKLRHTYWGDRARPI